MEAKKMLFLAFVLFFGFPGISHAAPVGFDPKARMLSFDAGISRPIRILSPYGGEGLPAVSRVAFDIQSPLGLSLYLTSGIAFNFAADGILHGSDGGESDISSGGIGWRIGMAARPFRFTVFDQMYVNVLVGAGVELGVHSVSVRNNLDPSQKAVSDLSFVTGYFGKLGVEMRIWGENMTSVAIELRKLSTTAALTGIGMPYTWIEAPIFVLGVSRGF